MSTPHCANCGHSQHYGSVCGCCGLPYHLRIGKLTREQAFISLRLLYPSWGAADVLALVNRVPRGVYRKNAIRARMRRPDTWLFVLALCLAALLAIKW